MDIQFYGANCVTITYKGVRIVVDDNLSELGGKSISFNPDRSGLATTPAGTLRIRNPNRYGIIFGGLLEFEITLKGEDWQSQIATLQQAKTLPVKIQAGEAKHMTIMGLSK